MNKAPEINANLVEGIQTPFSLSAEHDPRTYLKGLQAWPGMPTVTCRRHLKPSDKKKIAEIFSGIEENTKIAEANDSIAAREHASQLFRSHNADDILRGEELQKASTKMSLATCFAARAKIAELVRAGKELAAALSVQMAELLLAEFVTDAQGVEGRLVRGGVSLSTEHYNAGGPPITEFELWTDFLLAQQFSGIWFLKHYWPTEFVAGKYDAAAWAEFLKEISKD
jgi:hypothetical protein